MKNQRKNYSAEERVAILRDTVRLHSAIGYVTPQDMLAGRQTEIHAARDRKLEEARRHVNSAGNKRHETDGYNDCAR